MTNTISNTTVTHKTDYNAQDQDTSHSKSSAADYWDYYINSEIPWYERAIAGALLPVVAPLSLVSCHRDDFAFGNAGSDDAGATDGGDSDYNDTNVSTDHDADGDGEPACVGSDDEALCDCDDTDPNVNHQATEMDDNGIDDDCDGVIDLQYVDDVSTPDSIDSEWTRNTACDDQAIYSTYTAFSQTQYVPLAFHVLRNSDGSGGLSDTTNIQDTVDVVNNYFAAMNVEFYVNQQDEIQDSNYNHLDDADERFELLGSSYASEIGINIFIVDYYSSSNVLGAATFPGYEEQGIVIVPSTVNDTSTTLSHELGHYFNLYHTHQGYDDELVARTNCTSTSDFLCETEADPAPYWVNSSDGCYYDSSTCQITSCGDDDAGTEYTPDIGDVMNYYPNECKDDNFAVEQQQLMLCTMQEIRTELEFDTETPSTEDSVGCTYSKYATIQEAIIMSSDGDTIEVCTGTYYDTLELSDKSLTLAAKAGHAVTINGSGADSPLTAIYSAGTTSEKTLTLSGITFTNGSDSYGGGVYFSAANAGAKVNLEMSDCAVTDNTSSWASSGAVYAKFGSYGGSANLSYTTVSGNTGKGIFIDNADTVSLQSVTASSNSGGGVAVSGDSSVMINNTTINNNTLADADCGYLTNWGAGLSIYDASTSDGITVSITSASITDNNATACTVGYTIAGGIFAYAGSVTIDNTEVLRNSAGTNSNAGGVGLQDFADFTAVNSDFGTSETTNNTPYDIAPHEDAHYIYGNNVSFTCVGSSGDCG